MAKRNHTVAFVLGSLAGGLVGAAAALLNTPQSGRELKEKVLQSLSLGSEPPQLAPPPAFPFDDADRPVSEE